MDHPRWVTELFNRIDARDLTAFLDKITPTGTFRFANWPEAKGTDAIRAAVGGFYEQIAGLTHTLHETLEVPGGAVVRGEVSYQRKDGTRTPQLPFCNVFKTEGEKIAEYAVYADVNSIWNPAS